jgi:hypothetical protein
MTEHKSRRYEYHVFNIFAYAQMKVGLSDVCPH